MRSLLPLACLPVLASGCVESGTGTAIAWEEQAIVGGQTHTGDPAVVALTSGGSHFCTGTLISKRIVLTAAHCLPPYVGFPIRDIAIFTGPDMSGPGEFVAAVSSNVANWDPDEFPDDIGILALERQVDIEPARLPSGYSANFGDTIRIVGYGKSVDTQVPGQDGGGIKRVGYSDVDEIYSFGLDLGADPSIICSGDSGGPGFAMNGSSEALVSINSRSDCEVSSYVELVEPHKTGLIDPFMASNPEGGCGDDGICAVDCSAADPDCGCIEDGFCTNCPEGWWWDPDCPAACGDDGVCLEEGCAVPDPDCSECTADGTCDESCDSDPDCTTSATGDGGGCQTGGSNGAPLLPWLLFGLAVIARRRTLRAQ